MEHDVSPGRLAQRRHPDDYVDTVNCATNMRTLAELVVRTPIDCVAWNDSADHEVAVVTSPRGG